LAQGNFTERLQSRPSPALSLRLARGNFTQKLFSRPALVLSWRLALAIQRIHLGFTFLLLYIQQHLNQTSESDKKIFRAIKIIDNVGKIN
jgi:hypothetical protein